MLYRTLYRTLYRMGAGAVQARFQKELPYYNKKTVGVQL